MTSIRAPRTEEPAARTAAKTHGLFTWTVARERLENIELEHAALIVQDDTLLSNRMKDARIVGGTMRMDMGANRALRHLKLPSSR